MRTLILVNCIREAFKLEMSQKLEKVQKGGRGSASGIKKSKILNVDFLIRGGGGGEAIFSFFSQV